MATCDIGAAQHTLQTTSQGRLASLRAESGRQRFRTLSERIFTGALDCGDRGWAFDGSATPVGDDAKRMDNVESRNDDERMDDASDEDMGVPQDPFELHANIGPGEGGANNGRLNNIAVWTDSINEDRLLALAYFAEHGGTERETLEATQDIVVRAMAAASVILEETRKGLANLPE